MIVKIFFARVITDWSGVGQSVPGSQVGEAGLDVGYLTGPDCVGTGDGKGQERSRSEQTSTAERPEQKEVGPGEKQDFGLDFRGGTNAQEVPALKRCMV